MVVTVVALVFAAAYVWQQSRKPELKPIRIKTEEPRKRR